LGYEFNPVIGVRGQLGWARYHWDKTYWWGTNLTGDLMVNLSNWWAGYNPDRFFDVQAFVGLGAALRSAHNIDTKKFLSPIVRVGLQGNFHVSKQFDVNLDLATNGVAKRFNNVQGGLFFADFSTVQVGFTYHFKESASKKPAPVPEPVVQIKEVVRHDTVFVKTPAPAAPKVQTRTVTKDFSKEIFFTIGKTSVNEYNQQASIDETVAFMKQYPDAKLTIDGYADKSTGGKAHNLKLSKERAQHVADALKKEGIDANRITIVAHGDVPQIYKDNAKNRVTTLKSTYQAVEVQ
jgi:outer membrane protein OmpA-like peptidoglycan-associated protein